MKATWCNRFKIHLTPGITRIEFGDIAVGKEPADYHTVMIMSTVDAKALADALLEMMQNLPRSSIGECVERETE